MQACLLGGLTCGLLLSCGRAKKPPTPARVVKPADIVWCQIQPTSIAVPNQVAEEWAIRRAIFLYETPPTPKRRCFIEVTRAQPPAPLHFSHGSTIPDPPRKPVVDDVWIPAAILDDLKATGRQVARVAECKISRKGVQDRTTGEYGGDVYSISDVRFLTTTAAEAKGGWWRGPKSAASYTYVLQKIDGVWVVTERRTASLS
jgi:hypothetical protein